MGQNKNQNLSVASRVFWLSALFCIGLVPSLLFFIWIERNCSLPILPIELGWPWISLLHWPLAARAIWNLMLFFCFGAIHSFLAREATKERLRSRLSIQALRASYVIFSGLCVFLLMALWQPLGVLLWVVPLPFQLNFGISVLLFWTLMGFGLFTVAQQGVWEFIGLKQLFAPAEMVSPQGDLKKEQGALIMEGWYAKVRHPLYLFTLLAIWLTPILPLDRALLGFAVFIYLWIAIPIEEKKLLQRFGAEYLKYQKKVPCLLPFSLASREKS